MAITALGSTLKDWNFILYSAYFHMISEKEHVSNV